jgi:hypothetical protein
MIKVDSPDIDAWNGVMATDSNSSISADTSNRKWTNEPCIVVADTWFMDTDCPKTLFIIQPTLKALLLATHVHNSLIQSNL